ncbi:MAG: DotI/IcmL/TraM family protein [Proteobacteria bacterium]|nr:DotI/IcmL/TraM family protein [Pseudomonadota bacterium]
MDNPDPWWEQNNYYRDASRNLMRVANIQVILILLLIFGFFFYAKSTPNPDRYFAESIQGQRVQMLGFSRPIEDKTALSNWVARAATQIMTFGFNDIDQRFSVSKHNFTAKGWDDFYKAMVDSKIVYTIFKSQQLITSVPVEPPLMIQEGLINGKYSWVFDVQMLITFRSGSAKQITRRSVRVVVDQVPTRDNPSGVGISEWYMY